MFAGTAMYTVYMHSNVLVNVQCKDCVANACAI